MAVFPPGVKGKVELFPKLVAVPNRVPREIAGTELAGNLDLRVKLLGV